MLGDPEFDKYEKFGDYHWRAYRMGGLYADHVRRVRTWITERRVLDVGCGDGLIAAHLALTGHEVEGVDPNPVAVELAHRHRVNARVGSAYRLSGQYEAVYCGDTLEHLRWPRRALRQFRKVAPVCYIATPPRGGPGLHDPRHVREWTPAELTRLMRWAGWREVSSEVAHERILAKFTRVPWWRICQTV